MFIAQGSRCASCHDPEPGSKNGWQLDHRHDRKKGDPDFVREILCHRCNSAIAQAKECVKRLANCILYLKKHA